MFHTTQRKQIRCFWSIGACLLHVLRFANHPFLFRSGKTAFRTFCSVVHAALSSEFSKMAQSPSAQHSSQTPATHTELNIQWFLPWKLRLLSVSRIGNSGHFVFFLKKSEPTLSSSTHVHSSLTRQRNGNSQRDVNLICIALQGLPYTPAHTHTPRTHTHTHTHWRGARHFTTLGGSGNF